MSNTIDINVEHGYVTVSGNKWSTRWLLIKYRDLTIEEAAAKVAATMVNCIGCTNCTNCSDCVQCDECTNCSHCVNCSNCSWCYHCSQCVHCTHCSGCSQCDHCTYCWLCSNSNCCGGCLEGRGQWYAALFKERDGEASGTDSMYAMPSLTESKLTAEYLRQLFNFSSDKEDEIVLELLQKYTATYVAFVKAQAFNKGYDHGYEGGM